MEEVVCENCGDIVKKYPSQIKENNFCSHSCHSEWNVGENNHFWNGGKAEYECSNCEDNIKRYESTVRNDEAYCSTSCQIEGQKIKGYDSHFYNRSNWMNRREEIKDRDNNSCQWCGKGNVDFHVHHLRPIQLGGKLFDGSNLVTLCNRCHGWAHKAISD